MFCGLAVVYGNVTNSRPGPGLYADGLGSLADVVVPEHIYQTRDGSRILFVDTKSCARVVNRISGQVTTILGDCIQLLYLIVIVYQLFWNIPSSLKYSVLHLVNLLSLNFFLLIL